MFSGGSSEGTKDSGILSDVYRFLRHRPNHRNVLRRILGRHEGQWYSDARAYLGQLNNNRVDAGARAYDGKLVLNNLKSSFSIITKRVCFMQSHTNDGQTSVPAKKTRTRFRLPDPRRAPQENNGDSGTYAGPTGDKSRCCTCIR